MMVEYVCVAETASSPLMVEATTVKKGLQMALDLEMMNVIVESDCLLLVNVINQSAKLPDWQCDVILEDINQLKSKFVECFIQWISRIANMAADWLAKFSLQGMCRLEWVSGPPSPLLSLLAVDVEAARSGVG